MSLQLSPQLFLQPSLRGPIERVGIAFALLAGSLSLLFTATPLRADEAYVCGPDKIVYVAVADLERMKRTNPCIAAYYGLKVEKTAEAKTSEAKAAEAKPESKIAEPVKEEPAKPVIAAAAPAAKSASEVRPAPSQVSAPPVLKRLAEDQPVSRSKPAAKMAMAEVLHAAPGTDFRNVRVLNAALPEDAIFHHTR